MQDATAGDPMKELKWTHKSLRETVSDFAAARPDWTADIARLLREQRFLRTNRKCSGGNAPPRPQSSIPVSGPTTATVHEKGWPVISVDGKEGVDRQFRESGRCYRRQSRKVLDHDFAGMRLASVSLMVFTMRAGTLAMSGSGHPMRRQPCSCHDPAVVARGGSLSLPERQAVADRSRWRGRQWVSELGVEGGIARLADEFGIIICVSHYPPGASKWNWIEHHMFSYISENWAGEPLVSYETMLVLICRTRTNTGISLSGQRG